MTTEEWVQVTAGNHDRTSAKQEKCGSPMAAACNREVSRRLRTHHQAVALIRRLTNLNNTEADWKLAREDAEAFLAKMEAGR